MAEALPERTADPGEPLPPIPDSAYPPSVKRLAWTEKVILLWAQIEGYKRPQFVAGFPVVLREGSPEQYEERRKEAEAWFRDFGDSRIEFFTVEQIVARPEREVEA